MTEFDFEIFFFLESSDIFIVGFFKKAVFTIAGSMAWGLPDLGQSFKLFLFFIHFSTGLNVDKLIYNI